MVVSTGFVVIDCKEDIQYLVYCALTQPEITDYISSIAEGAVATYPSIKAEELGNLFVALPSLEIAKKMNVQLKLFFDEAKSLKTQSALLARERDLLLPCLMSGKLEVSP